MNISGLSEKDEANQVSALIFQAHFVNTNVIYERAKFNERYQQEGEMVNQFVTVLHTLAEHCAYGALKEEMIRDRLVVGVRDTMQLVLKITNGPKPYFEDSGYSSKSK